MTATHPRCDYCHSDANDQCTKYPQHRISYILNRQLLQYGYCPPHYRAVVKDLNSKGIEFAHQLIDYTPGATR